ncbi:MAG: TetR family transcriptional regulator [Leifsonia sp.]
MGVRSDRAAATRRKLIDAARNEFQMHGFAGGRVDAIAEQAGVNKRLIYVHFGSKVGLFSEVLADNVARVSHAVPFTQDDLPGYAVSLFDYWTLEPTAVRLFSWRNLEVDAAPQFEDETYRGMIQQIEESGASERAGLPAPHVLALLFAVLLAWAIPADAFQRADANELARRRESITLAVRRILRA